MMLRSSSLAIFAICIYGVYTEFSPFDMVDEYVKQFKVGMDSIYKLSDTYSHEERNYEKEKYNTTLAMGGAEEYDFIIVGGGTAGLTLAHRLSEEPRWKILVLEAGGIETLITQVPALHPQLLTTGYTWGYKTCPQKYACLGMEDGKCSIVKSKCLGGDSSINDMLYTRGHPRDYDIWADTGMKSWCWANVLPYFKKIENACINQMDRKFRHYGGPIHLENFEPSDPILAKHFLEAGEHCGLTKIDYNGKDHIGLAIPQVITKDGKRYSVAKAYLKPISERNNLVIKPYSQVLEVLVSHITKEAHGVTYMKDGEMHIAKATKEIILTAGSINTPQLLMLSGIGPHKELSKFGITTIKDLPVGFNLKDQVSFMGLNFIFDNHHTEKDAPHYPHQYEKDYPQHLQHEERPPLHGSDEKHEHSSVHEKKISKNRADAIDAHEIVLDSHKHPFPSFDVRFDGPRFIPKLGYQDEDVVAHNYYEDSNKYRDYQHNFILEDKQDDKIAWYHNQHSDDDIIKYLKYGKGPLSSTGLQLVGYIKTDFSRDRTEYPDIQLLIKKTNPKGGCYHFKGYNLKKELKDIFCKPYEGLNVEIVLLHPKSKGFLILNDLDPYHQPFINPQLLSDEDEFDIGTLVAGIRKVLTIADSPPMKKLGIKLVHEKIPECDQAIFNDEYWKCAIKYLSVARGQITGTARMGVETDKEAVVDDNLKVYGVHKLRVADASIIPVSITGNLMAPEIMIGEKAADILKECWLVTV